MSRRANAYIGRAGQMAVMAEYLARGWNVAIPEVDVGDDLFVVRDSDGNLSRVQVKTATARAPRNRPGAPAGAFTALFNVALAQLRTPLTPELTYVFAVRLDERWAPFVVFSRQRLDELHDEERLGSESRGRLLLTLRYERGAVSCGRRALTAFVDDWARWPRIEH